MYKVRDIELQYKRLSNNIGETIQIFGPTSEDLFVTVSLTNSPLHICFFGCFLLFTKISMDKPMKPRPTRLVNDYLKDT